VEGGGGCGKGKHGNLRVGSVKAWLGERELRRESAGFRGRGVGINRGEKGGFWKGLERGEVKKPEKVPSARSRIYLVPKRRTIIRILRGRRGG